MHRPTGFIYSKPSEPAEMTPNIPVVEAPAGSQALARSHMCTRGASHVHEFANSPARCRICDCILRWNIGAMFYRRGRGRRGTQGLGRAGQHQAWVYVHIRAHGSDGQPSRKDPPRQPLTHSHLWPSAPNSSGWLPNGGQTWRACVFVCVFTCTFPRLRASICMCMSVTRERGERVCE